METKDKYNLISPYSKIKVYWSDRPENYSKEAKNRVRNYFATKYGVNKNNINVVYQPVKLNKNGELIEISGAGIENIMDINYQRALMKELVDRDGKTVDFNRIIALDDKVNNELNIELETSQHRSWVLKWLTIDNFLCFGEKNYIPFNQFKGLNIVNSTPENQGGKTTFTIDTVKFLLHGTTTKTDKNEDVFNTYTDKNELVVRGMIEIDGEETIIERKMKRSLKKTGEWNVINKVNYYEILPDGEEKELSEENSKITTSKIKETIGSEKDFEMLVLATEKNLEDLIGLTSGESGKVLTRLIGLEILEIKEAAVRKMYNEFASKKKSNDYDIITLSNEIIEHENKVIDFNSLNKELNDKLNEIKIELGNLNLENDKLINSKEKIDVEIATLNPTNLESEVNSLTEKGIGIKAKMDALGKEILDIGEIVFDEDTHYLLTNNLSKLTSEKAVNNAELVRLNKVVDDLILGGICQSCNRKLDDVDNSNHIDKHKKEIEEINKKLKINTNDIFITNNKLVVLNEVKDKINIKNRLELDKDRLEVEIGALRNKVVEKKNDLKKYKLNLDAIEHNKRIEVSLSKVKTDISVLEYSKDTIIGKIERILSDIKLNSESVIVKNKLIETIKKEEEIDKIFKIYIELVGKKGISKLVLRSVLPIINSEVQRLLDGVCDFEVELFIDDKNDVKFLLIKDDVSKQLKSGSGFEKTVASLALRCVLGKLSTLPMPNFITFDEIFGKIAPDNIDKLKPLFEKLKDMYEIIFLITHNDLIKDWGDKVITVSKVDNISRLNFK